MLKCYSSCKKLNKNNAESKRTGEPIFMGWIWFKRGW